MKRRQRNISDDRLTSPKRSNQSDTSENSLPVPNDLVIDIFSRLPLKSIARCRCVSKFWSSFLRRPDFTEMFLTRSSSRPKLLIAWQKDSELFLFSAYQPRNIDENPSPVVVNHHMKFSFGGSYQVRGLVHGFLALVKERMSKGKKEASVAVICNPSTGQVLSLPRVKTKRGKVRNSIGYDPIDNNFKVLSMTRLREGRDHEVADDHQVMTLGTENPTWTRIEGCRPPCYPHTEIRINGFVYYTSVNTSTESYFMVCFDVKSEKFSYIEVKEAHRIAVRDGSMINYNGKLGLYGSSWINGRSTSLKFWVLEDLEKQEWSEHEYLLPALWKDLAGKSWFTCVGVTRENEIVLSSCYPSHLFYLIYFNHERNTVVRVDIQGIDDASKNDKFHTFLYHVEDVMLCECLGAS